MKINARARLMPVGRTKTVALVGFGDSSVGVKSLPDNIPVWTLNDAERYGITKYDRLFEMHPYRDLVLEGERWERLVVERNIPVMMLRDNVNFPDVAEYPLNDALNIAFRNLYVGEKHARYITSTFGYMLICAVLEQFKTIKIFGFEFLSDTEHTYQAIGAALLIGWAAGYGCEIHLPKNSPLFPPTLYGYEDYQMISRSNLEQALSNLVKQESSWVGRLNTAHAQVVERQKNNLPFRVFNSIARYFARHSDIQSADDARGEAFRQMYMTSGAIQIIKHFIDIVDRKNDIQKQNDFSDNFFVTSDDNE